MSVTASFYMCFYLFVLCVYGSLSVSCCLFYGLLAELNALTVITLVNLYCCSSHRVCFSPSILHVFVTYRCSGNYY